MATISEQALKVRSRDSYYASQRKLFVLVIGVVSILPLVLHIWLSSREYYQSWVEKTSVDLVDLAISRRETIELFLKSQEDLLAGHVELNELGALANPERLKNTFAAMNKSGLITDLGVIDAKGNHLAYEGPYKENLLSRNYAQAQWFSQTMKDGRYISDVFLGYRDVPHQVVAVASADRTWLLRATINSHMFNSLLEGANVGPGGDAFIINRAGELQSPSRHGLKAIGTDETLALYEIGQSSLAKLSGGYLTAALPLKDGDWLLVLRADVESSLAGFYDARQRDMFMVAIAAALVLIVATLIVRYMVGKIEEADKKRSALGDRVRQAEKMALVGRIAASVAHEINNPLQIIGDHAGLLKEMLQDEETMNAAHRVIYEEIASGITKNVNRASTVTHKLLGFSRPGGEGKGPVDINRMIEETVGFIEKEALANGITITRHLQEGLPVTVTDGCQLQQVFLNLLNNAVEAIGRSGSVSITTSLVDGQMVVEFADSGPGLPPQGALRIFDPFYSTKEGRGTGLGLSISFNIMQRLGGSLQARNGSHKGAVFTVSLPMVSASNGEKPAEPMMCARGQPLPAKANSASGLMTQ